MWLIGRDVLGEAVIALLYLAQLPGAQTSGGSRRSERRADSRLML